MKHTPFIFLIVSLILVACGAKSQISPDSAQAFTDNVRKLCGQAFIGEVSTTDPGDDEWRAAEIKMHVRDCVGAEIKIALHVGEHRSITWLLRDEDGTLALRHDHRQKDGSPSVLTFFGGPAEIVTDTRAEFSADQSSQTLFDSLSIPDSKERSWAVEARPVDNLFAYERRRPGHLFRIEFDTSKPIKAPPTPWGW